LGQNKTYILCFLVLSSPLSKIRSRATEGADIFRRYKQIQLLKNWNIARYIMCFIMNVVIAKQKFLANLTYLFFLKFGYRQNMF